MTELEQAADNLRSVREAYEAITKQVSDAQDTLEVLRDKRAKAGREVQIAEQKLLNAVNNS